jgi:hypothetical protein
MQSLCPFLIPRDSKTIIHKGKCLGWSDKVEVIQPENKQKHWLSQIESQEIKLKQTNKTQEVRLLSEGEMITNTLSKI